MKTKFIAKLLLVFCVLIGMTSCGQSPKENGVVKKINVPINHFLAMTSISPLPIGNGVSILLQIKNTTNDCAVFPNNYGLQLFVQKENDWIEIQDRGIFGSKENVRLDPRSGLFPDATLFVNPDYSKLRQISNLKNIRIVVKGSLCKNGVVSEQTFADYVDLPYQP